MFMFYGSSNAASGASSAALCAAVASAIAYGEDMQEADVRVSANSGSLVLEGTAASDAQIQRAAEIARDIAGLFIFNQILKA